MSKEKAKEAVDQGGVKESVIGKVVHHITQVMDIIDLYEPSRPGQLAFTKLEEAIMWSQVMVNNIAQKQPVTGELLPAKS